MSRNGKTFFIKQWVSSLWCAVYSSSINTVGSENQCCRIILKGKQMMKHCLRTGVFVDFRKVYCDSSTPLPRSQPMCPLTLLLKLHWHTGVCMRVCVCAHMRARAHTHTSFILFFISFVHSLNSQLRLGLLFQYLSLFLKNT